MHTAACNIFSPAYRHKRNTPAPSISAAEIVTVNAITSFRHWPAGSRHGRYPMPELRGILRRSQRARNRHFSHVLPPSAASAPHMHCRPLRHPVNLCPMLITSRQHSLAFGKVRSAKTRRSRIPSVPGNAARFLSGRPTHSSGLGAARIYSLMSVLCQARPVPYPVPHGPGASAYSGFQPAGQ